MHGDTSMMARMMRRAMALIVSMAILLVGSVPTMAAPVMPAQQDRTCEMMDRHAPAAHFDDCVIECGCRCHADIDSLPHQLAPHLFDASDWVPLKAAMPSAMAGQGACTSYRPLGEDPPPRHS